MTILMIDRMICHALYTVYLAADFLNARRERLVLASLGENLCSAELAKDYCMCEIRLFG